jgi:flagellar protein FliJ
MVAALNALSALNTAREVQLRTRDAAWRDLLEAQRRHEQTVGQGQALQRYREDTQARFGLAPGRCTDLPSLRGYQDFVGRLDEALAQHQQACVQAEQALARCRQGLLHAQSRLSALDKLIERRTQSLQAQAAQREQRAADEQSQNLYSRKAQADAVPQD